MDATYALPFAKGFRLAMKPAIPLRRRLELITKPRFGRLIQELNGLSSYEKRSANIKGKAFDGFLLDSDIAERMRIGINGLSAASPADFLNASLQSVRKHP